ncbi:MAG: hypothetical protein R3310_03555, partial [Candidatus Competibacteraceae bacterium]|nr:hypothetical protein [Candidatus Competibacteraceae bacterium]
MGLKARLQEVAFAHPRGFPVLGWGGAALWRTLRTRGPITLGLSPRQADLLVLAGEIPPAWRAEITALFETLPLPRGALWLQPPWDCPPPDLPLSLTVSPGELNRLDGRILVRRLLEPDSPAQRPQLPDLPAHPWRGIGPHGQGGEGMMGGHPYGRPMAMAMEADARDHLALDNLPIWLGPFFPGLPSGLQLDLVLQGDRVHHCQGVTNRFPHRPATPVTAPPALTALTTPVPLRLLERTRLASHLGWLADFLELAGRSDLGA